MANNMLYISAVDKYDPKSIGIMKKIHGQCKAFKRYFDVVDLLWVSESGTVYIECSQKEEILGEFRKHRSLSLSFWKYLNTLDRLKGYQLYYVRFDSLNREFYRFIKAKKIILEIPTYPIFNERLITSIRNVKRDRNIIKFLMSVVSILACMMYSLVAKWNIKNVVLSCEYKKAFFIKAIQISNAVDVELIDRKIKRSNDPRFYTLCAIANLSYWHGYDRMIYSIHRSKRKDIKFLIVGDGIEKQHLQDLVNELKLNDQVEFLGAVQGDMLYDRLQEVDVGVDSLGLYRKGIKVVSSLKSKEYLALGIPFITVGDSSFNGDEEFMFVVKNSADEIDMDSIIAFMDRCRQNKYYEERMKELARTKFTWDIQVDKIIKAAR